MEGGVKRRLVLGSTGIRITAAVRAPGGRQRRGSPGGGRRGRLLGRGCREKRGSRSGQAGASGRRGAAPRDAPRGPVCGEVSLPRRPRAACPLVPHHGRATLVWQPLAAVPAVSAVAAPAPTVPPLPPAPAPATRPQPQLRGRSPRTNPRESSGGAAAAGAGLVPRVPRGRGRPERRVAQPIRVPIEGTSAALAGGGPRTSEGRPTRRGGRPRLSEDARGREPSATAQGSWRVLGNPGQG